MIDTHISHSANEEYIHKKINRREAVEQVLCEEELQIPYLNYSA